MRQIYINGGKNLMKDINLKKRQKYNTKEKKMIKRKFYSDE